MPMAAIYLFGFLPGVPLLLVPFARLGATDGWAVSLGMAGRMAGIVYLFFFLLLNVPLHPGVQSDPLRGRLPGRQSPSHQNP